MTALEEIKNPLEGRDIATLTNVELVTEISRLLSTLESLQRENEELREKTALHSADAKTAWAECDELRGLVDRLKMEAQTHATEARTANSTIHEIYQIISGGKGEPGNWHGAEPVREYVEAAEFEVKRYRVALIAAKTRMRNCRGAIESDQVVDKDVHGSLQNGIRDIEAALASTGGEHHAE